MPYKVGLPPSRGLPRLKGSLLISNKPVIPVSSGDEDPILTLNQWYPIFKELHRKVVAETPNFDYLWLKEHRPDLYQAISVKEAELDSLRDARLSEIMAIIREWRTLILKSEFKRMEANKPQPQQGDLNLKR